MIGIFDSGLGGLCALKELRRLCPKEDMIYLGDTARLPYGTRSFSVLSHCFAQALSFFASHGVDRLLVACGTVSSQLLPVTAPFPIHGIIEPAAAAALRATKNGKIGVIGTQGTVRSGAFEQALRRKAPHIQVFSLACPLFVPLVENGFVDADDPVPHLIAARYLSPLQKTGIDTLILGCTHFPLLAPVIKTVLPHVVCIDSGKEAAAALAPQLHQNGRGHTHCFVTDNADGFTAAAALFADGLCLHAQPVCIDHI